MIPAPLPTDPAVISELFRVFQGQPQDFSRRAPYRTVWTVVGERGGTEIE